MVIRKLLLSGILLAFVQSSGRFALANSTTGPQANTPAAQELKDRSAEAELLQSSSEPQQASPSHVPLHHFLLSTLVLPLPPLLIPDLLLPPYNFPSFNSHRLDQELRLYTQYLRTTGTPDILIVGSSRSLQGIDPAALQEALVQQGYPRLKIFNFGINGGTAKVNELLLRRLLTSQQMPRLIIWADGSRAFNNGRPDITYNGIVASAGYQRVMSGSYPIPSQARWDLPILRATAHKALASSSTTASPARNQTADLTEQGFQIVSEVYHPETYYQRYPWVPGSYDADYLNFNLEGAQQTATIAIAQFAQAQQIPLVFVNLPLTADYLDATRQNYEQQFRQQMRQLSVQHQFIFCDLSQQQDLMQNAYFADPSHINRHGAKAIAIHLASVKSIPWQMFKSNPPAAE